jgi:hypothetical protein
MVYYKDLTTNEVYGYDETEASQLPYIQQAIDNGWENITGSYPYPTPPPTAEDNKATASSLLAGTDWTTIADIGLPTANPRLSNQDQFIAYRQVIRQIAVYPPAGEIVWATPPTEVWLQGE